MSVHLFLKVTNNKYYKIEFTEKLYLQFLNRIIKPFAPFCSFVWTFELTKKLDVLFIYEMPSF